MNTLRTILLMGFLTALIVVAGGVIGGKGGVVLAFFFAVLTNIGAYWFSDKIVLAQSGAQPISREEAPELYEVVERIAQRAGIPVPQVYLAPTESPNAFATGRDPEHSSIAVTAGILRILNMQELEGVLAHELAHVKNRDILITTIAAVLASVLTTIAHWGMYFGGYRDDREGGGVNPIFMILLAVLAPLAALLVQMAISRAREFEADHTGAKLCGHPEELASALARLEQGVQLNPDRETNPALAPLYIVTPNTSWISNLLSTHPPIEERIRKLRSMGT
jgi:heat shock protein HtpX